MTCVSWRPALSDGTRRAHVLRRAMTAFDSILATSPGAPEHEAADHPGVGRVRVVSPALADAARIRTLLGDSASAVEASPHADHARRQIARRPCDIVLVAAESLDPGDLGALTAFCELAPRAAVLVLASREGEGLEVVAVRGGAQ